VAIENCSLLEYYIRSAIVPPLTPIVVNTEFISCQQQLSKNLPTLCTCVFTMIWLLKFTILTCSWFSSYTSVFYKCYYMLSFLWWQLAQKELQKINMYKAPRDKLVCILNCCRVISNLLLNASLASKENPPGADEFLPVLIYVTLKVILMFLNKLIRA